MIQYHVSFFFMGYYGAYMAWRLWRWYRYEKPVYQLAKFWVHADLKEVDHLDPPGEMIHLTRAEQHGIDLLARYLDARRGHHGD